VARAKRTERAEARRRYRAANAPAEPVDVGDVAAPPTGASGKSAASAPTKQPAAPVGRMGFREAFGASFRPLHVREDLASLPWLAIHSPALWLPLLITVASVILTAVAGSNALVVNLIFPYFVMFPAIGGVFIGGFLAPRAAWLVGIIVGLAAAVGYIALGFAKALPPVFQATFDVAPQEAAVTALVWSAIFGGFLGAAAAWYRRFLRLSSPNRNRSRAQSQKKTQKPGDGRTRTAGTSQKAPVKR
jgi:hypothetical protein